MQTMMTLDQDACWEAVRRRDASHDGQFFTAVATTGIYCRPQCPARLPLKKNVRFFATAAEAEAAGFRACKRCKPDQPPLLECQRGLIVAACRRIESAEESLSLEELAAESGLSPHHFHRLFKRITGLTPKSYAAAARAKRMSAELATQSSVTGAIYSAGYSSSSRFYEAADATLGMTPSVYRRGGEDQTIEHATVSGPFGLALIARTSRGICSILLGDNTDALESELRQRFPKARIQRSGEVAAWASDIVARMDNWAEVAALPLDIRGTAFQWLVWQALREIPPGSTQSYTEVARRIGRPKSVRAVANACAQNPVAIAIPCHRVVGANGSLTGYRWGIERKRALLARERGETPTDEA